MRKRRLNSGYSGNVDNRRNIKGCLPASKHYMERVLGRLDSLNYFLLDSYPGASVAYSLRSLNDDFENPVSVVKVRRSTDNSEADFTALEVSDGTLECWCGGGDGFVSVWYDQSGNGKNAVQGTAANQPQIVSMGVLNKENGNPCLTFDGVNDHLQVASVTLPAHVSSMVVAKSTRTGTNLKFWFEHSPSIISSDGMYFNGTYAAAWNITRSGSSHYGPIVDNTDWIGDDQAIASLLYNGHGYIYKNSQFVSNATSFGTSRANTNATDTLNIGSRNGSSLFLTSNVQEMLIYPAMSPERMRLVETNMNLHYNVYDASTLLGQYSGAAAAYSLRKVSYTNDDVYVVRVRRSTDNQERDFLSNEVTDGTLETWCDSGDGFVSVWYDQSGNNHDAAQATAANQPKIVSGGSLILENGRAAIYFSNTPATALQIADNGSFNGMRTGAFSYFSCAKLDSRLRWQQIFGTSTSNTDGQGSLGLQFLNNTVNKFGPHNSWITPTEVATVTLASQTNKMIASMHRDGSGSGGGNGANVTLYVTDTYTNMYQASGTQSWTSYNGSTSLIGKQGTAANTATDSWIGTIQEIVIYPTNQSSNRIAIEDNINEYYDVFDRMVLLLHMDGPNNSTFFYDSSRNGLPITANGNAKISTTQSKFGGSSAAFDGNGDYLTVANDASLQLTNSVAWTLEFWFYANALAAQQHLLHRYLVTSPFNGFGFAFGSGGAATTTLRFWDGATWRDIETSVPTGQWRHVAVSYEGSGSTARMFLDGIAKGAAFSPSASIANTTNNLGIGAQYDGSLPFNGYIDELKIVKGKALYTGNFTPPQAPFNDDNYTSLLLHMDGTNGSTSFVDSSSNSHTITANGNAVISSAQSKFGGTSAYFDGNGDYLSLVANSGLEFGVGDFTIEFWARMNSTASLQLFFEPRTEASQVTPVVYMIAGGGVRFYVSGADRIQGAAITANQWYHIAVSRGGGSTRMFIDGNQTGNIYADTNDYISVNTRIGIGWDNFSSLNGYIDDLRITKNLSRYNSNFTPPIAPHPDPVPEDPYFGYVSLLLPMDDEFVDKSFRRNAITANGNAQISTAQSKFGGASAAFDGTGDYLSVADSNNWHFGSGDFTAEAWVYPTASPSQPIIMGQWDGVGGGTGLSWVIILSNNSSRHLRFLFSLNGSGVLNDTISGSALTLNAWNHVALVRSGDIATAYLNGTPAVSFTMSAGASLFNATNSLTVGASSTGTQPFDGYIDDLRITKGIARYGSFQPPAQAFADSAAGDPDFADVSLLLHMDGADGSTTFTDSSSNGHTVTVTANAAISTAQSKFGGASAAFDGDGDSLAIPASASLALGAGDFTIEGWFYSLTSGTSLRGMIDFRTAATGTNGLMLRENNGGFLVFLNSGTLLSTATGRVANQWQHVAVVRKGTTVTLYVDGALQTTATSSTNLTDNIIRISGFVDTQSNVYTYNGYIDDLRITKGIARYDGSYTPPTKSHPTP